jgi:uncharacterized secreted protein with C-terminal beta-propeller domain
LIKKLIKIIVKLIGTNINNTNENNLDKIRNMETQIEYNSSLIGHHLSINVDGTYQLSFLPIEPGIYILKFFMNQKLIKGSPYELKICDKLFKECIKPIDSPQVGVPYILTSKQFINL